MKTRFGRQNYACLCESGRVLLRGHRIMIPQRKAARHGGRLAQAAMWLQWHLKQTSICELLQPSSFTPASICTNLHLVSEAPHIQGGCRGG